eukprot:scaffold34596_cov222-Amphora_coffeaeformis.AAC.2
MSMQIFIVPKSTKYVWPSRDPVGCPTVSVASGRIFASHDHFCVLLRRQAFFLSINQPYRDDQMVHEEGYHFVDAQVVHKSRVRVIVIPDQSCDIPKQAAKVGVATV